MQQMMRGKPRNLQVFEALQGRMAFSAEEQARFDTLKADYSGKTFVDRHTAPLTQHCFVGYDLVLVTKQGSSVEIDTLIATGEAIHFYFIRSFSGHFAYRNHGFWREEDGFFYNPNSSFELVRKKLATIDENENQPRTVKGHLVFPQEDFSLADTPDHLGILTRETVPAHFEEIMRTEI